MTKRVGYYWKEARFTLHNVLVWRMNVSKYDWGQICRKMNMTCRILYNLKMRKVARKGVWMMRIGGRWISHTRIELS